MKIATWNVNGIRARQAQLHDWIERERPEILCLQEIKAAYDQVPAALCEMEGYWCYWHGVKGYSGVALHVRKDVCPDRPPFSHPPFDIENRIVLTKVGDLTIASIYVPRMAGRISRPNCVSCKHWNHTPEGFRRRAPRCCSAVI